ncbi:phage tail protein [Escherichia coli]
MANLPETPQWEEGIYQIEVSDPVLGGPDGISNRQGKQLASRTLYLKQQVEKGGSDLAKHIAAADPHTQYAPKASPTFTGTPTAPTPANSDNSKKLATTEFVAKALAALAGSAPETLDTLKELADALGNDPNFATTVLNKLAEKLAKDQNGADIPDPALFVKNLGLGESKYVIKRGKNANGAWIIWSDGAVEVFGSAVTIVDGLATVTFPVQLPAVTRNISIAERISQDPGVSPASNPMHVSIVIDNTVTTTGFKARCVMASGMASSNGFSWRVYAPV